MNLLQMSFSGAVMIIVTVLVRAIAIHRFPKRTFLVLWGLIMLRLLVPFSIPSVFSVYTVVKQQPFVYERMIDHPISDILPIVLPQSTESVLYSTDMMKVADTFSVSIVVWGIGVLVCLVIFGCTYHRCIKGFRESIPIKCREVDNWLAEHRCGRRIMIRYSDRITTPLTYGVLHPVILVPKELDWGNKSQIEYVLTHEYIHIKHCDAIKKWLLISAVCIHWFNPFVWLMFLLANRDMELSCDEQVLELCGVSQKTDYARMLVSLQERNQKTGVLCNGFSRSGLEERIIAIMKMRKKTALTIVAAVIAVLVIDIAFATSAKGEALTNYVEHMLPRSNPYGTKADYESLFALRTSKDQELTVDEFREKLVTWVMEDYYRSERVREDIVRGDFEVSLTEEDQDYVIMTYVLLGEENARKAASLMTGKFGGDSWIGKSNYDAINNQYYAFVWDKLYQQFVYRIESSNQVSTQGQERVKIFWSASKRHTKEQLEQEDILKQVAVFAEENKDRLIIHQTDMPEEGD